MLTPEENEALCRVGPGTPMGTLLRRYWVPAFQLGDLPEPDCPPIRVTILGEDFVAFRDTEGRIGFLDELCAHRGASLVLGRVEDCGIRCLYHGWKYAVDGTILETPNLTGSRFRERVKHGSYPVRESGGLGWVYLGPPEAIPPFPVFRWDDVAAGVAVTEMVMDCNWMQVLEGSIDSSHVGILHLDTLAVMGAGPRSVGSFDFAGDPWDHEMLTPPQAGDPWPSTDNAPRIEVEDTPYGFQYAALREAAGDPGKTYVRVTAFVMPYTAFIAGTKGAVIVVPRDDDTCSSFGVFVRPAGTGGPARPNRTGVDPSVWGPEPENRRLRVPPQDREAMASGQSFAGFRGGNRVQDGAVQMSEGTLYDRTKEHLVPADLAIIKLRRVLADSIRLLEEGKPPLGLGAGFDLSGVEAVNAVVDANTPWQDLVPDNSGTQEQVATQEEQVTAQE
jgi:phthalate 4,5-dioxygenase oxygenase subunit